MGVLEDYDIRAMSLRSEGVDWIHLAQDMDQ
jgi:hypothetical protein